jgi:glucose-6-phosphate isomerase
MDARIVEPQVPRMDWSSGDLRGDTVRESVKTLGQMRGLFQSMQHWERMDPNTIVYRVKWCAPVPEGTEGGIFWGTTMIEPGRVGDEYFMTHGHFHANRQRAEYYSCTEGEGMLIMMDVSRQIWTEPMFPGSLHFISSNLAHRVANIGQSPLKFVACWPSDAGHDYESIRQEGFAVRVVARNDKPVLMRAE